jgi:DNA-directed RNA polymerase alpha subunit
MKKVFKVEAPIIDGSRLDSFDTELSDLSDEIQSNKTAENISETSIQLFGDESVMLNDIPIEELGLPIGIYNKMKRYGYNFISQLTSIPETQLLEIKGLGKQTVIRILNKIEELSFEKLQTKQIADDENPDRIIEKKCRSCSYS